VLLDRDGTRAEHRAAALATHHGVDTLGLDVDVADGRAVGEAASAVADGSFEPTSSSRTSAYSSSELSSG